MSPENQGVFQPLKEVTFRRNLAFYGSRKWGGFGGIFARPGALWLAGGIDREMSAREKGIDLFLHM